MVQKIQTKTTTNNDYLTIDLEQCRHAQEMNTNKNPILDIKRKWKNDHIQLITNVIREGQKLGHSRIARGEIKELKQTETSTLRGNMVLQDTNGDIQSEAHSSLHIMQTYIKEHFARMRGNWEVGCITPEDWKDKAHMELQTDEQSIRYIRRSNSKLQQYANYGEKENNKLMDLERHQ